MRPFSLIYIPSTIRRNPHVAPSPRASLTCRPRGPRACLHGSILRRSIFRDTKRARSAVSGDSMVRAERERIRRDDVDISVEIDERAGVERLRVDDRRIDIREDLEFVRATDIVAVARRAVRNDSMTVFFADLPRYERFDHPVRFRHAAIHLSDLIDIGASQGPAAGTTRSPSVVAAAPGADRSIRTPGQCRCLPPPPSRSRVGSRCRCGSRGASASGHGAQRDGLLGDVPDR